MVSTWRTSKLATFRRAIYRKTPFESVQRLSNVERGTLSLLTDLLVIFHRTRARRRPGQEVGAKDTYSCFRGGQAFRVIVLQIEECFRRLQEQRTERMGSRETVAFRSFFGGETTLLF